MDGAEGLEREAVAGEEAVARGDAEVAAESVVNAEDEVAVGIFVADSVA